MPPLTADSNTEGFWGEATATIDWCEENYAVSSFLAEFCKCLLNWFGDLKYKQVSNTTFAKPFPELKRAPLLRNRTFVQRGRPIESINRGYKDLEIGFKDQDIFKLLLKLHRLLSFGEKGVT